MLKERPIKYFAITKFDKHNNIVYNNQKRKVMVILHIANIGDNLANGVHVAVPRHVQAQANLAQVLLVNIRNINVAGDMQCEYKGAESFPDYLPEPFNKPDIAIFHEVNYIEYIKLYKQLLKRNIPYIIVPHGEITQAALNRKWLKKKIAYTLWFNRFVKKAAAVQCLSENEAKESVIAENKIILPNGMELHEQKPVHFDRKGMKLVYIGRLDPVHKGLDLMIKAVGEIAVYMRENDISLNIYGPDINGRLATINGYIEEENVGDIVHTHPPVFGEEKARVINEGDLFIQTSRFEGLPMGILEALSYGMPVIVTEGTRLMEQVTENNCGYAAGDCVESIADAIKQAFVTKDKWKELGIAARAFIKEHYEWSKIGKQSVRQYEGLINE